MRKLLVSIVAIGWLSMAAGAAYADQTFESQNKTNTIVQAATKPTPPPEPPKVAPAPPPAPVQAAPAPPPPKPVVKYSAPKAAKSAPTGDILARIRMRESGGNYATNTGNGYYGAYQFDVGTWGGYGGYKYASDAPPAVQDAKAAETYARRGCNPWPHTCY